MLDWIVRRWPLLVTIGAFLVFDGLSVFALRLLSNTFIYWAVLGAVVGIWWGQILLAVAITGLAGRTWIEGLCIGLTLTLVGLAAFAFSMLASGEVRAFDTNELVSVAAIPSLLIAACLPLSLLRQWRVWRFVSNPGEQYPTSAATNRTAGIEDLFLVTTVVAAAFILARIPAVVWEVEVWDYWPYLAEGCLCLGAVTAILIVPTCWVVFRIRGRYRLTVSLGSLWLVAIGLAVMAVYVASFWNGSSPMFKWEVVPVMAFTGALMATLLGGLLMFRISGYKLGERRKKPIEVFTDNRPTNPSHVSATYSTRALAGGLLVVAAVANIPVASVELARRQQDQALAKLSRQASASGGSIVVQNRQLLSLIAWPEMTDADLHDIDLSSVQTLSLADSQVTDAILPKLNTPRLISLDLSGTQISEQALAQCNKMHLNQLNLSAPQFTGECFASWTYRVKQLDLSRSGVTDDTLVHVKHLMPLERCDLSHTAVSDAGPSAFGRGTTRTTKYIGYAYHG
jgi:hypothetical protein